MPLEAPAAPSHPKALGNATKKRLCIADVALFYGERSGGIRTYLEAKAAYAERTGAFEHHLVVPGWLPADETKNTNLHVQRSLQLAASNGYRVPLGGAGLHATLRQLRPDIVLLHDPYWTPRLASRAAHEVGAAVIAVHHSSAALHAAGLPGPQGVYTKALVSPRLLRSRRRDVRVDSDIDARRPSTLRLRLGLDPLSSLAPELLAATMFSTWDACRARRGCASSWRRPPPLANRGCSCSSAPGRRATPCASALGSSAWPTECASTPTSKTATNWRPRTHRRAASSSRGPTRHSGSPRSRLQPAAHRS